MNITDRIMNAIIFGGNSSFDDEGNLQPIVHPLSKSKCACGDYVREKDRIEHLATGHGQFAHLPLPSDEEINAMYAVAQTESAAFRTAHS